MKHEDFVQMLTEIEKRMKFVSKELAKAPAGELMITQRRGKADFIQLIREGNSSKRQRKGINKRQDLIKGLCRKKYLTLEQRILINNYKSIEILLEQFSDSDADSILALLPERFRELPEEYFFADNKSHSWREEVKRWASEPFEQSTFNLWEKDKTTSQGLKVRTKSEVIIAEKLDQYNIPYRYEQMLYIENQAFAPDFTILTKDGIKYWEHAGKVNEDRYIRKHNWKLSYYQRAGIVPWKNLILTYDDLSGGIDTRIIEAEIFNKLL